MKLAIAVSLTPPEAGFLSPCTDAQELTCKEIADRMNVSARTVDGYRDALFEKLGVKSRVGLFRYALLHSGGNPD